MVIKKKGKWQFGYKDTYSLDDTLRPIIGAGLQKFYDVLKDREKNDKCFGVPSSFAGYHSEEEVSSDSWFKALEDMIYAFTAEEPCMEDYNVSINMEFIELPEDHKLHGKAKSAKFTYIPDEEAYNVYRAACVDHEAKVQYGLELFGKHYQQLWW
jgi:hypothetical protein